MQLTITGHHIEITPALRSYTESKMERLNHYEPLIDLHVVLSVEKQLHKAEATGHAPGHRFHSEAVSRDLYATIDTLVDKLAAQICRDKERRTRHHLRNSSTP
ncbi:Sigma 54 modulation protein/ribosomal protein S30EA [mine drainage metagenome]|uniref:Sigma 54 modulation protein/ribosomal protein S30EA n=1 Tax=mine drainage metagenome TaxID=410659 RepID=T1BTG4_9ZZZZ